MDHTSIEALDDDHPLWLINAQIDGLLEGIGASEDHEDVLNFLRNTGLPEATVKRMHKAIVHGDTKVADLERQLADREGLVCGDCDGSGWLENSVEGRYPCTCMTEAEPYQLLQSQLAEAMKDAEQLKNKLHLMFEMPIINDTYIQVRNDQDFAIDDIEYDMFAAGWKNAVSVVIRAMNGIES